MEQLKRYCDYFTIDESYYPIINPESVKDPKNRWDTTYPHESFIGLLEAVARMLARESNDAKRSIWLDGSYGTGKSRLIWALYNLLKSTDKEFNAYFDKYDALKKEPDLRTKLLARKNENILTVFRYSSGEINSIKDLIVAVFNSVTHALEAKGMNALAEQTIRGKIADKITSAKFRPTFEVWLAMPEYRGLGGVSGKSVDDIAAQLRNLDVSAETLINDIMKIADDMGNYAFSFDVDYLKNWIKEVIRINNLDNIIFMWDEFSSFFKKNRTEFDSFQNLEEISSSTPFNFIIVTHEADSLKAEGGEASALYDRFTHKTVKMPDYVAFDLIHDALEISSTPGVREEYEDLTKELASYTAEPRRAVCEFSKIDQKIMRGILPIHPMAALLLKYISTEFASNQRSMFNFIKTDDADNLQAFQWFIQNRSPENGDILTIDYLWNFFYESGTDENTTNTGRSNLDMMVATILDTYALNEAKLSSDDEKRVLKTVLMMQAISRKLNNGVVLLRPTDKNIELAFMGDDQMENHHALNIIKNILIPNKILYKDTNGKVDEYAAAAISGDQSKIDEIKEQLRNSTKTATLVNQGDLVSAFNFTPALKSRFDFTVSATVDDIQNSVNRILNENKTYRFRTVICFARDENEQQKMSAKIKQLTTDPKYKDIIFIDASSNILGLDNFESWLTLAANEQHFRKPDPDLANNKAKEAKNILTEWKNRIAVGQFVLYSGEELKKNCGSIALLYNELSNFVLSVYPLTFDNAKASESFFTDAKYANSAKYGIAARSGGIFQEKFISPLLGELRSVEKYWEVFPTHSLSVLKIKVKDLVDNALDKERRIPIGNVIDMLMVNGFTPCALYTYLIGFLLKEYAGEPYRYSEGAYGDNGGKLSPDKLGDMIGEYVKHTIDKKRYVEKYIEVMTPTQAAFVSFVADTFGISDMAVVESAAAKLRTAYKNKIRYPLWCLKVVDKNGLDTYIDKLSEIMYSESDLSVSALAEEMGELLIKDEQSAKLFSALIKFENASMGMTKFLDGFEHGEIVNYANKIGVSNIQDDVLKQIATGAKSYLWDQSEGEEQLRKLLLEYKIIYHSNAILMGKATSTVSCLKDWRRYSETLKLPYAVLKKNCPELSHFISCLVEIVNDGTLSNDKRQEFLNDIIDKSSEISELRNTISKIYTDDYYSVFTSGLSDEEINAVISTMPNSSFLDNSSTFDSNLKQRTDVKKKEQKKYKLIELWKEYTDSKNPMDWSEKHMTPIKAMVSDTEMENANILFSTFTTHYSDAKVIEQALDYLSDKPAFIDRLSDQDEIDDAFRDKVVGRYSAILYDLETLREHLSSHCSVPVYDWYGSGTVQREITSFATATYRTSANEGVMQRIDDMSPEEAKTYLKDLVKNDVEVGISIITKGGE